MDDYRTLIQTAILEKNGKPIFNGSLEHATAIAEEMVSSAASSINILAGDLNKSVYGSDYFINAFEDFIQEDGHSARFLVDSTDYNSIQSHPLARFFKRSNCNLRVVDEAIRPQVNYHMALMDEHGYRFEQDKEKFEAIVAFGDEENAKHLQEVFDVIWELSPER